jgi:hypothetical protein
VPEPDAIAAEVKYHRSCYSSFTDTRSLKKLIEQKVAAENRQYGSPYQRAFFHPQNEIQREVIDKAGSAVAAKVNDIRSRYVTLLNEKGVVAADYRESDLKVTLCQCFHDKIQFVRASVTEPQLVAAEIPSDVLLQSACLNINATDM